ncbi:DUF885 domain-containing protein [Frigoribacterium faeni]|uniref:Uncharacterized protein (DUF885 family) n=1 Tax=Frigoribacterium faeni TaxID=145483 RepID=A0A7W3JHC5_9MICO|nr:DUF885 domain-containing protein [Frigoribacterium faeni]MBA8812882.1 uncharacterized protein (DUF885 family) [Frigoribacterium faeni]BFF14023.1 DUF885 domain-containing protein [Microbacterium flavescens]GEK81922.1 hypothetical protein FFA01_02310 [Frigoribacterium faeni]
MTDETPSAPVRRPTTMDGIAERWVDTLVDLDPTTATWIGRPGRTSEYGDLSPAGHDRHASEAAATLREVDDAPIVDDVDRVTRDDLRSELRLDLEHHASRLHLRDLNVIASPVQAVREVFDLMPVATEADWADVSGRLSHVGDALDGYVETLRAGLAEGIVPARRQVEKVAVQCDRIGAPGGFFSDLVEGAVLADGSAPPPGLAADLATGAASASAAYLRLRDVLRDELLPRAVSDDAVGREAYGLHSRRFLGASVDLDETYEWGLDELARMTDEQEAIARSIEPGASVRRAIEVLDADPARRLDGTDALREWMQALSDRAVDELGRSHFDIPEEVRRLECRIAPTRDGGIYYTSPSDDFSRPGRMWWSVPEGVTRFGTWRETTTVYHEGVPGHHLQLGMAVHNRATLNTWRRQLAGTSGHAEGWALYAERLMDELGYLDDPGDRLGMLDGQRMRAARVVLDIGVHLGKPFPGGGGAWNAENALAFMRENVNMDDEFVVFEVDRYLGWPGQAPSYKVGQRIWEDLRAERQRRDGADFDMRRFHRDALRLGGVGLDTLRRALLA